MTGVSRRADARGAAEWFAVMRGPGADGERAAFEAWRAIPANADAYARLEDTWNESLFLANGPAGRGRDLSQARRKGPPAAVLAAGVALLTLLSAGLVAGQMGWLGSRSVQRPPAVRIAAGEISAGDAVRAVRLSDGSRVTLDRGAAVVDRSAPDERRFVLLRGRARFDVAHDAARPFLVDAGEGRVVAHGTVFDVGIEDGAVRVILLKGSVEVLGRTAAANRRASRFLAPGEQLVVARGEVGATSRASATLLSWPDPMIGFDDIPLAEAVAAFNRTGGPTAVRLADGAPGSLRVSGAFRRDDPRGFAEALAASFAMQVDTAADGSLVLRTVPAAP